MQEANLPRDMSRGFFSFFFAAGGFFNFTPPEFEEARTEDERCLLCLSLSILRFADEGDRTGQKAF